MAGGRPKGRSSGTKEGVDEVAGTSATPPRTSHAAGPNAMRVRAAAKDDSASVEITPTEDELDAREARQAGRKRKAPGPSRKAPGPSRKGPAATGAGGARPADGPPPTDPA
jgi:hypothetical protein